MAKKDSKNSYWQCNHGCPESKTPCKHLDRLLESTSRGVMTRKFMEEHSPAVIAGIQPEFKSTRKLETFLYSFGFREFEVELIMDHYIGGLSLREISKQHGYADDSGKKVWRYLQDMTDKLKKSSRFKRLLIELVKEGTRNE